MVQIIDGKTTAAKAREEIAQDVNVIKNSGGKIPHLAAILVGHDGASETYVNGKERACAQVGFHSTILRFEDSVSEKEILDQVDRLNLNDDIDGFIVQLPLPAHINEQKIIERIDPAKDVDGFHPVSLGRMVIGLPTFISATPAGILELFKRYGIPNVDTTEFSIEEISSRILDSTGVERRVRP